MCAQIELTETRVFMDSEIKQKKSPDIMEKIAAFIVDKRNLFFLLFIFAGVFSCFSSSWVKVENDITTYLPDDTETNRGLTIMNDEFVTYATADVMVSNISYERAEKLSEGIEKIKGVSSVEFENNDKHFKGASALYKITFDGTSEDKISSNVLNKTKKLLTNYDTYISSDVGSSSSDSLKNDMSIILVIAAVIIVLVLLFTSKSYAEVPVLIITFGAAGLLNKGTNFLLGEISFISNSVAIVLQLALAIDYAIILCHRYTEEREFLSQRDAVVTALKKAIIEISSSSLTTISGLAALMTMQFGIGKDLALVLIKAIFFSLLSVFTLMPGLIMLFGKQMEKTSHKNLVPKITFIGKFDVKTRRIIPPIFLAVMTLCFFLSNNCSYCFGQSGLKTLRKNESQIASDKIDSTFRQTNMLALVVPAGSYEKEAKLLRELDKYDEVDSTLGLANTEAMDGYMLTDKLNARKFGELTDVDYEAAMLLYTAYAAKQEDYGRIISDLESYSVPLIDMITFLYDESEKGYITLDDDISNDLKEINDAISEAELQLKSDKYSRMLVYLNMDEEGTETFEFLDKMHTIMYKYYPKDSYIVGNTTSDFDLSTSFSRDNLIISILSALFVILVLLFTFKSAGLPVLLIAVIQGSIWINFSFPYLMKSELFFLGYLIVTSIQMGANIDYAIVISNRFNELKKTMNINEAMIETLNQAFPTIITSGAILSAAGILIGCISTNGVIASIGTCLGRGTIISMILVLGVLPQILLLGNSIIERTEFSVKAPDIVLKSSGGMLVNGWVTGKVSGIIDAEVHGVVHGDINVIVRTGNITNQNSTTDRDGDKLESIKTIENKKEINESEEQ